MPEPAVDPQTSWDERYREKDHLWGGHVNPQLERLASALTAGTALDLGCGEGGDALWLAARGWQVTGLDVSGVALERAQRRSAQLGLTPRTRWVREDLLAWSPAEQYDLVSAQFLHSWDVPWTRLLAHVPAAVAPGGSVIIGGHHVDDASERFGEDASTTVWNPQDLASALGMLPPQWEVTECGVVDRTGEHAGANGHHRDTVFAARRRG